MIMNKAYLFKYIKTSIKMKTSFLCIILALTVNMVSYAQKKKNRVSQAQVPVKQDISKVKLALTARCYGDSIVLRWGYKEAFAFRTLNKAGFIIERLSLDKNNKVLETSFQKLTSESIKPWSLEVWKKKGIEKDKYAAVAAQALYGKSFSVTGVVSEVEAMQNMADDAELRHSFALLAADISPVAANGLGLRYVDRNIEPDKKYIYRIYSLFDKTFFTTDTAQFVIAARDKYVPFPPSGLNAVEGDMGITLKWPENKNFSAYYIEKSTDGGKHFVKLNDEPYIKISKEKGMPGMSYYDSLEINYKPFLYRVAGISPFGDISPWSETVKAEGRDRTPPEAPLIKEAKFTKDGKVKITWDIDKMSPDLKGYFVGTSDIVNGPFAPLHKEPLSKETRTYIDDNPIKEGGGRYYVVVSVDTAKNVQQSMPAYVFVPDSKPPSKPTGLTGKIDTTGLARISWNLGKEKDLQGYRIYFSNQSDGTFMALSGTFQDTAFTDTVTLNTLNKYIYYKVVAVDKSFNNSPYSDALQLAIPDEVPPVAPVFKKYLVADTSVYLEWYLSNSTDVDKQVILRKEKDGEWAVLTKFDAKTTFFTDKNVEKNKIYEYSIYAVDHAKLESPRSVPVIVKIYDTGIRDEINGFTVKPAQDKKSVKLSWSSLGNDDCSILIYRSFNGDDLKMYASAKATEKEFTDLETTEKGTYKYSIRAIYSDGGKSPMTEVKEVIIN